MLPVQEKVFGLLRRGRGKKQNDAWKLWKDITLQTLQNPSNPLKTPKQARTKVDLSCLWYSRNFHISFVLTPSSSSLRRWLLYSSPSSPLYLCFPDRSVGCLCFPGNPLHVIRGCSQAFPREYLQSNDFRLAVHSLGKKKGWEQIGLMPWSCWRSALL